MFSFPSDINFSWRDKHLQLYYCCQVSGLFVLCFSLALSEFPYLVICLFMLSSFEYSLITPHLFLFSLITFYVFISPEFFLSLSPFTRHFMWCIGTVFWVGLLKQRTFPYLPSPASFLQHKTLTDERTNLQKDDFSWGGAVGFAAGWSEVGTVCGGFPRANWSRPFSSR